MKHIIIIALMLFVYVANAEYNAVVPGTKVLQTKVIKPLIIHDYDNSPLVLPHLPDVIKGQRRPLTPSGDDYLAAGLGVVKLFELHRDKAYDVHVEWTIQTVSDKLKIKAHWYWHDEMPVNVQEGTSVNLSTTWWNTQDNAWMSIHVTEIDATDPNITLGPKTFVANIKGWYLGL